jgi:hypothetical protein
LSEHSKDCNNAETTLVNLSNAKDLNLNQQNMFSSYYPSTQSCDGDLTDPNVKQTPQELNSTTRFSDKHVQSTF